METAALDELGSGRALISGLLLMILGLALALPLGFWVARAFRGESPPRTRWGALHLLWVVSLFFSVLFLIGGSMPVIQGIVGAPEVIGGLTIMILGLGAAALLIVATGVRLNPRSDQGLGWRPGKNGLAAFAGLLFYVPVFPAFYGGILVWGWLLVHLGAPVEMQPVAAGIRDLEGLWRVVGIVFAVLLVPLLEELLFRVFLQSMLVRRLGGAGGILVTSLVFASLHIDASGDETNLAAVFPIFLLSLALGFLMLRTQRLASVWVLHAVHNGVMLFLLFFSDSYLPE